MCQCIQKVVERESKSVNYMAIFTHPPNQLVPWNYMIIVNFPNGNEFNSAKFDNGNDHSEHAFALNSKIDNNLSNHFMVVATAIFSSGKKK